MFDLIATHVDGMRIDSLIVEKRKTSPALRDDKRFYPEMLGLLLKFILPKELPSGADEVIVITHTIPVNKKRHAVEKGVQLALAKMLPPGMKHRILHPGPTTGFKWRMTAVGWCIGSCKPARRCILIGSSQAYAASSTSSAPG